MRKLVYLIILTAFTFNAYNADAQVGNLRNKAKKAVINETKKSSKSSSSSTNSKKTTTNSSTSSKKEAEKEVDQEYTKFIKDKYYDIRNIENGLRRMEQGDQSYPDDILSAAKELDYPNTMIYLKEKGNVDGSYYDNVYGYGEKFPALFEKLKPKITKYLASASNIDNKLKAIKEADNALKLAKAGKLILPENEGIKGIYTSTMESYKKIGGEYFAKIYTGDFHIENAGSMVFFNKAPIVGKEENSTVKTTFSNSDYIYSVSYLKGSLKDIFNSTNGIGLKTSVYIDGAEVVSEEESLSAEKVKSGVAHFTVEILPDPENNKQNIPASIAKALAKASVGKHTITIQIYGIDVASSSREKLMKGEFTINCPEGSATYFEMLGEKYHQNNLKSVKFPKAERNDDALANSIKKLVEKESWAQGKEAVKVAITDKDWTISRNPASGLIEHREIAATVAVKSPDGKCKCWQFTFKQPYVGGSYTATEFESIAGSFEIAPENL